MDILQCEVTVVTGYNHSNVTLNFEIYNVWAFSTCWMHVSGSILLPQPILGLSMLLYLLGRLLGLQGHGLTRTSNFNSI